MKVYRAKIKCILTKNFEYFKEVEVEADDEDEAYDNAYVTAKELIESDAWIDQTIKQVSEETECEVEEIDEIQKNR